MTATTPQKTSHAISTREKVNVSRLTLMHAKDAAERSNIVQGDERYDLSLLREILEDESAAIERLRAMLETERGPIDRHSMMSELETRLYKSRAASARVSYFGDYCLFLPMLSSPWRGHTSR